MNKKFSIGILYYLQLDIVRSVNDVIFPCMPPAACMSVVELQLWDVYIPETFKSPKKKTFTSPRQKNIYIPEAKDVYIPEKTIFTSPKQKDVYIPEKKNVYILEKRLLHPQDVYSPISQ